MMISDVSVWLAFLAGLASFLSPCVLSLIPAYISYLAGRAAGAEGSSTRKWTTLLHGLAFISGFSLVFILFGAAASALGGVLFDIRLWLTRIGGAIVVILGLHMTGIFRIPFLAYDLRVHKMPDPKWGYLSSILMGIFFSAGWSPCIGPVLGMISTFALTGGSIAHGVLLLSFYSAGLGLPFLVAALSIGWVVVLLRRHAKAMRIIEIIMGVILVAVGVLLILGQLYLLVPSSLGVDFGL